MSSGKWRPFCLGLNVLSRDTVGVETASFRLFPMYDIISTRNTVFVQNSYENAKYLYIYVYFFKLHANVWYCIISKTAHERMTIKLIVTETRLC